MATGGPEAWRILRSYSKILLKGIGDILQEKLDPDNEQLKALMTEYGVLTAEQMERVYKLDRSPEKVLAIIDFLIENGGPSYAKFRYCIVKIGRDDLLEWVTALPVDPFCDWTPEQNQVDACTTDVARRLAKDIQDIRIERFKEKFSMIEYQSGILREFVVRNILSEKDVRNYQTLPLSNSNKVSDEGNKEMNRLLVPLLTDVTIYNQFIMALRSTKQGHIANYIDGVEDKILSMDTTTVISGRWERLASLADILECRYGLLLELNTKDVLTELEVEDIKSERNFLRENSKLIELMIPRLSDEPMYQKFLAALCETFQGHIAKSIDGCMDELDKDRCISRCIKANFRFLVQQLDIKITGLLQILNSEKVISDFHMEAIDAYHADFQKKEELLKIMKRRSCNQYQNFLKCLHHTKQSHVASVLQTECGVAATVEANGCKEYEKYVVGFDQLAEDVKLQVVDAILKKIGISSGIEVLGLSTGHSIWFHFLVYSLKALKALRQCLDCGELKPYLMWLLYSVRNDEQPLEVQLQYVSFINFYRCEEYLISCEDARTKNGAPPPVEAATVSEDVLVPIADVREQILLKSFFSLHSRICKTAPSALRIVYELLASVSMTWREILNKRVQFRITLRRRLAMETSDVSVMRLTTLTAVGEKSLRGITELNGKLYIASSSSNKLMVFKSSNPFDRLDDIALDFNEPHLKLPQGSKTVRFCEQLNFEEIGAYDIASCTVSKSIYISDINNNFCVWNYVVEEGRLRRWFHEKRRKASDRSLDIMADALQFQHFQRLNVTPTGQVLFVDRRFITIFKEQAKKATLCYKVLLPYSISDPHHIVKKGENFIIGCGMESVHQVCEIKAGKIITKEKEKEKLILSNEGKIITIKEKIPLVKEGKIIRTFGRSLGFDQFHLNLPLHVDVDRKGHIFVADFRNGRVVVLDSKLSLCKVIVCEPGDNGIIGCPRRLYFSDLSCQLFVGLANGSVEIYSIKLYQSQQITQPVVAT